MFTVNIIVQTITGITSIVIIVGAFGFIGYSVKGKEGTIGYAAKTGAFAGFIYGVFGAILSLISYYYFPQLYTETINQMTSAGTPVDMAEMVIKFMVYLGILWMPIVYGLLGAGLSALGGLLNLLIQYIQKS